MRTIATDAAPKAIGPYSQAIATDLLVFTAGQVALDPKSGELIGRTTAEQTEQVFANLKAVLSAAGTSLAHVVKTTVYLADMADFAQMNEVYAKHFGAHKPARPQRHLAPLPRPAARTPPPRPSGGACSPPPPPPRPFAVSGGRAVGAFPKPPRARPPRGAHDCHALSQVQRVFRHRLGQFLMS